MNSEKKQQLLISILTSLSKKLFTVTEVRDKLLNDADFSGVDRAKIRRWVAGKFVTYQRRGWLTKVTDELKNRDYFKLLPKFSEELQYSESGDSEVQADLTTENSNVLMKISRELEQYRKTIITQMSEIEEYKRIEHAYPELKRIATHRFHMVRDENYRLLGKMKALEHLISRTKEQSQK